MSQARRLDELEEKLGRRGERRRANRGQADYWQRVQELFTRDVTVKALRELAESDARDTVAYFSREIDFDDLKRKPFWKRVPASAFRLFEAIAWRLSPARRLLFAGATIVLAFGWADYLLGVLSRGGWPSIPSFLLVATTLLFALLTLELRDKLSLKGDLEIARQIQFGLLPFEPWAAGTLRARAAMRPANTVGGDYFDLVELGDGRFAVAIGDVAGKGMPAALLMALLQGSLRTLVTAGLRGAELVARLNQHLTASIPRNRLVTLFYAEVDAAGGPLRYVNAGHNPPLLARSDGALQSLAGTGVALGIMPDALFECVETAFGGGDRLLLYTDGIVEAENPADEAYGEERLRSFLAGRRAAPAEMLIDGLVADVLAHAGPLRPRDDMTLLVLDRGA
ncbi:MAG TPA: SpoIIE family protein phosphatase [Vicinamibacteria bacterium]|nr:SpoIIE family protein phosphatase [Vicinamibacteria bacterium]